MPEITVSLANPEQLQACYRLAYQVFCQEMGTMREDADHERGILCDEAILRSKVLCAEVDGEVVGTLAMLIGGNGRFPEHFEHGFDLERFVPVVPRDRMSIMIRFLVKPEHRGSSVPMKLIAESAKYQFQRGLKLLFCDCQPHLVNLYETCGFRPYAPVFEQPGFGIMVPLVFVVPDVAHLRSIRSPIIRYVKGIDDPALAASILELLPDDAPITSIGDLERTAWAEAVGFLGQPRENTGAFEGFSEGEMTAFLERSQVLDCADGQQIVVKGHGTRSAYVILEGAVDVRSGGTLVARLGAGEMFGEFALLLDTKRTADVFAKGDRVRLFVLDERNLQKLLTSEAQLAAKFLLNLSRSLAVRLLNQSAAR